MTPSPEVPPLHYTEWGNVGEGQVLVTTWEGLFTIQMCSPGRMESWQQCWEAVLAPSL